MVTGSDGSRGLDVNGDGKPDIGPNGEILKDAPLAKGSDGFGVDVNGDGRPDVLLHGPVSPNAPLVQGKDGIWGIDVDGDGTPEIGLDGTPLPTAHLVESGGVWGVDVNGDGVPDVGLNGEILNYDALVAGKDGTFGLDVDGDGTPDLVLDGQVLPGAPIVEFHGVRGLDIDGDGIPDIGMDGKPLPGATVVTGADGVKGVDVDGDGTPDIGMDGQILKNAPAVTAANGVRGIDVNGDGQPDIALGGGRTFDTLAGGIDSTTAAGAPGSTAIETPMATGQAILSTAAAPGSGFAANGLGSPGLLTLNGSTGSSDPGTVLSSLGAPTLPPSTAVPMAGPTSGTAGGGPSGLGGAMPLGGGAGLIASTSGSGGYRTAKTRLTGGQSGWSPAATLASGSSRRTRSADTPEMVPGLILGPSPAADPDEADERSTYFESEDVWGDVQNGHRGASAVRPIPVRTGRVTEFTIH